MKKIFWLGCFGLLAFEILNVYFIMPLPGSQEINSIDTAYFLYQWRWLFRSIFFAVLLTGLLRATWKRKWVPAIPLLITAAVVYMANFRMAADHMFYQPQQVLMLPASTNKVDSGLLVIGVVMNGEAKAYPVRFLGYHHQVKDSVGGKPVLVTYCTVCRTGRVYEPLVQGKPETFRLVGMDHFNAMLEDDGTKSWWRQATGEAITGKLKGQQLPVVYSTQTSLATWLQLHPASLIMQADSAFIKSYSKTTRYEDGTSRDNLTGTDSLSWKNKSWVIGLKKGSHSKAYDWNRLVKERLITDTLGNTSVFLFLSKDNKGFFAFEKPVLAPVTVRQDTIFIFNKQYRIDGTGIDTANRLTPVPAYQEFWHSWKTFNPATGKY
jgi:hypothetical protein